MGFLLVSLFHLCRNLERAEEEKQRRSKSREPPETRDAEGHTAFFLTCSFGGIPTTRLSSRGSQNANVTMGASKRGLASLLYGLLILLTVSLSAHALSWQDWADIPIGGSLPRASLSTTASLNKTESRRLETSPSSLNAAINVLTQVGSGSLSLADTISKLQGADLTVISSAVAVATDGKKYDANTIGDSLKNVKTAVDDTVSGLDKIVQAVYAALYTQSTKDRVDDAKNWWSLVQTNFPSRLDLIRSPCGAIMGSSLSTLTDLGATKFVDKASKDDKRAVARAVTNAMLVIIVTRQICAGDKASTPVHAGGETLLIASFLKRVGDELGDASTSQSAQSYIDHANSPSAPGASNEQLMSPILEYLNEDETLMDGLSAALDSDEFRRAINSDRNAASGYGALGVMIAVADRLEVKSLKTLNSTIANNFNVRVGEYVKIDKSVDAWHNAKMQQIDYMKGTFSDQHDERMDALTGVNNKAISVTNQAAEGFRSIQGAVLGMQDGLKAQIHQIAGKVEDDAVATQQYLSNEIEAAAQKAQAQIAQIDSQVVQGGRAISEALMQTTAVANAEFDATLSSLSSASGVMAKLTTAASQQLQSAIAAGFEDVSKVVSKQIVDAATGLSAEFALVDRKVAFVNGRLEILRDQLASVDNKMQVANAMLRALDVSVADVLKSLRGVISDITSVLFENDWVALMRRYDNLRASYAGLLAVPQTDASVTVFRTSCKQENAYDLFLTFVHVLDVPDAQLARHLQKFSNDLAKYEAFGKTVIASLHQLSLLSTTCTALSFNMTRSDVEQKGREHATLIQRVAREFLRQYDEVVPIYMLRYVISQELEPASQEPWGDAPTQQLKAQRLRDKLQRSVGDFAQLTVMYAGADDARLLVRHIDQQYPAATTDAATFKRHGVMASKNAKLAIFWGSSRQLKGTDHSQLDRERLLRQGTYRGEVNATSPSSCSVAQNASFYPLCEQCRCVHFENFASPSDPYAGRAITVLNSTDPSSDFVVQATQKPLVDYVIEELALQVEGLGSSAYGKIEAATLTPKRPQPVTTPLWEDYTDRGRFLAMPSDVKGTLVAENQLTLSFQYTRQGVDMAFRKPLPLFCDNQRHTHSITEPGATLSYRCREVAHTKLRDGSDAVVASGVLRSRVDQAVCILTSATDKQCKVVGEVTSLSSDIRGLEVGRYVSDLTVYSGADFEGSLAICKGCSSRELSQQLAKAPRSFTLETPSVLALSFLAETCAKRTDNVMVCGRD